MLDYLIFGEFDSRDYGLKVFNEDTYNSKNAKITLSSRIGREGNVIYPKKSFEMKDKKYTCFLMNCENPNLVLSEIRSILFSADSQKLEDSSDKEIFYIGKLKSDFSIKRNYQDRDFSFVLTFTVQPQRFLKSGQKQLDLFDSLKNPTRFNAHPIISFVNTSESGDISFGDGSEFSFFDLDVDTQIEFDAETLNAVKISELGDKIQINSNFYVKNDVFLKPGINQIVSNGISYLKIFPRWWTI